MNIPHREITIPVDRSILFPVINCEANPLEYPYLKTNEDIINYVRRDENTIVLKEAFINNTAIPIQRVVSDPLLFPLRVLEKNSNYRETKASAAGYWVFLKPLPKGEYNLSFRGAYELGRLHTGSNYRIFVK